MKGDRLFARASFSLFPWWFNFQAILHLPRIAREQHLVWSIPQTPKYTDWESRCISSPSVHPSRDGCGRIRLESCVWSGRINSVFFKQIIEVDHGRFVFSSLVGAVSRETNKGDSWSLSGVSTLGACSDGVSRIVHIPQRIREESTHFLFVMCPTFPRIFGRRRAPTGSVTTVGCSADDAADASPKQVALFSIGAGWTRSSPRTLLLPLGHSLAGWVVCRRRFVPSRWVSFHPLGSCHVRWSLPSWTAWMGGNPGILRRHPFFFYRFGWWWMRGPQRKGWKRPFLLGRSSPLPVPGVHRVVVDVSSPSIPPTVVLVSMGREIPISFLFERKEPSFRFGFPSNPSSLPGVRGGGGGKRWSRDSHTFPRLPEQRCVSLCLSLSQGREGRSFLWGGPIEHLRCVLLLSSRLAPFIRAGCVPPIPLLPSTHTRAHPRPNNMAANMTVEK